MTRNATRFIKPILFQSLSGHPVYLDEFRAKKGEVMHVELARDTDLLVIAPASANTIGKFASGIADDFISTLFLARRSPTLIAPAMNTFMYRNPVVQQNISKLQSFGVEFEEPDEGYLACGDEGPGRLAPVEMIVSHALRILSKSGTLSRRKVVVTAGPTWEALDPVRVLTNRSSGKMGYAIAEEASLRGAEVVLISGPTFLTPPPKVTVMRVESAQEMLNAVLQAFDSADFLIKTAAVSDFRPADPLDHKRKKSGQSETLVLEPTKDILAVVAERKGTQIIVGFCAETENLEENALNKMRRKNLDFIAGNLVGGKKDPFGSDQNELLVLDRMGGRRLLSLNSKKEIARDLWETIIERSAEIIQQPAEAGPVR